MLMTFSGWRKEEQDFSIASNFLESKNPKQVLLLAADVIGLPSSKYKKNLYR